MAAAMADVWKQIAAELGRLLKPHGFEKADLGFIDKQNREVVRQLRIEKFRWNTPGHQRFQLILSLYLATGHSGEFTFKGQDEHYSLVFQKSAGYLWGEEACLYLVPETLPDEAFFTELRLHVTRYIVPFLQRCTSSDAVIAVLEEENRKLGQNFFSLTLAIALARLGRKAESRKHFRQCLGDPASIRKLAAFHGIQLDD